MKTCYGFVELFKRGLVIENWCDLAIKTFNNSSEVKYIYSFGDNPVPHNKTQYGKGFPNHNHIKLISPWRFREKTGIKFHFAPMLWNLDSYDFIILTGILNFNINLDTNINIMLPKKDNEYIIKIGTPLIQIIPLSESEIIQKNHLITYEEYNQIAKVNKSYYGWRGIDKIMKRNNERKSKCPFRFGE